MAKVRETKVQLTAQVKQYIEDMERAGKATNEVGSATEKLAQQRMAFEMLGASAMVMGAAAAAGVALAVSKWADFDQAMSNVQAATMESEENMKLLSDTALEAGARTVFSAEEAANAIEELAKAGVSTADILNGGLDGALDLAAAGGLGVAEAAGIAATALKTFNLEGSDMAHVADLLAAGAGKAMGDVTDLSAALNQSAMVANATGLSIEETTAALSAFASQGLLGSDAGTSFKSMLQSLTPTSGAAKQKMEELGISAYDARGNFVGLAQFAGNLRESLADLTVEQQQATLKTIFGSDAIRAATVLYSEGESGIREWIDAVDDQGYAAAQAAARLDNLKGDIEGLSGALDTALIQTGSGANEVLRAMVQWLTDAVDAYNELPAPLQSAALSVGIVTAAVGLLGGTALLSVNKIAEFKVAMATLGITGTGAKTALMGLVRFLGGPWGIGMIAAGMSFKVLTDIIEDGRTPVTEIGNALRTSADSATALKKAAETSGFEAFWMGDAAKQLKELPRLMDDAKAHGTGFWDHVMLGRTNEDIAALGALNRYSQGLAEVASIDLSTAQRQFADLAKSQSLNREQTLTLLETMPHFRNEVIKQANDMGIAVDSADFLALALGEIGPASEESARQTEQNAAAIAELEGKAEATSDEVNRLADAIRGLGSAQFDVREASRQLEDSVSGLNEMLVENGLNLDITTEAGRQTEAAIDDMAQAVLEQAAAIAIQTNDQEAANAALAAGRERLIEILTPYYGSRDAAAAYVDTLGLIEPERVTDVILHTENATRDLNYWLANAPKVLHVQAQVDWAQAQMNPFSWSNVSAKKTTGADGFIEAYADGGFATGIYRGGAPIHKFAERETGWEAYISGKADQRDRNRQIWVDAGERLGMGDVLKALSGQQGGSYTGPSELVVRDVDGALIGRMRVEASGAVATAFDSASSAALSSRFGTRVAKN